ncbi:MAG: MBL fold metallo-hydrolase [Cyanobacteriota bacterium]|nr:MBL fold metallo-hydrolase [Cyanobacteriota bacterium]
MTPRAVQQAPSGQGCPILIKPGAVHAGQANLGGDRPSARSWPADPIGADALLRSGAFAGIVREEWGNALSQLASPVPAGRPPREVKPGLWLFAPNRDTQGGSAWLLQTPGLDLLVDAPALQEANLAFLEERRQATPGAIVLTGRDGHGRCRALQQALGWPVLVQEQESYLLPGVAALEPFGRERQLAPGIQLFWTPGPSPGACVLLARTPEAPAQEILFCGRLLVPLAPGRLGPLRRRRTFHWPRQLQSLATLRQLLPAESPAWLASGAGLGALRGEVLVGPGAALLAELNLEALALQPPPGGDPDPAAG